MTKTLRIAHSFLLLAVAAATAFLSLDADGQVERRRSELFDYRDVVDLVVYDQPLPVGVGAKAADVEALLRGSDFGECDSETGTDLTVLPPRIFCRRGAILAVKSFAPFEHYIFELSPTSGRVQKIKKGDGQTVDEAGLPSPVLSAANLDAGGNIRERVRYALMLGHEINPEAPPIKFFIEIEDRRFFEHSGNDWLGIGRALFRLAIVTLKLSEGESLQGGSTVTEQVAKLVFLPDEGRLVRRIKALFLAESLERQLTKRQILELWLNLSVMGIERPTESPNAQKSAQRRESVRGFKTAARVLFNKRLEQCSPTELATLSALPRYPQIFPTLKKNGELDLAGNKNHRLLDRRRRAALDSFASALDGAGKQDLAARFREARQVPVRFSFSEDDLKGDEALITLLERDLKAQSAARGASEEQQSALAGREQIIVLTEVDQEFQRAISRRLEADLPGIKRKFAVLAGTGPAKNKRGKGKDAPFDFEVQVDVVVLWAEDGGMRALSSLKTSGGRVIPNRSNVNPRSFVASCAKPLHLAHGLGEGVISLHTLVRPADCVAPNGFRFDGPADDRLLPMSDHLVASRNQPFLCLGNRIGIDKVLAKWRELFPSCTLPSSGFIPDPYQLMRGLNRPEAELTPTELAEAYTALARQGEMHSARAIESMYVEGKRIELNITAGRQVFKPEAAAMVSALLRAGTKNLTQWRPTPGFDLALKTGSSSNSYWVVMLSPRLSVAVRYLITPAERLPDERTALKFSREVERRFERVFASNVVKPFADSVLDVIKQKRRGWLRGTFAHENVITVRIDPTHECATRDDSGVPAAYIRGTEPALCPDEEEGKAEVEH